MDANGGATIDNIQIGITNNNTIDTSTGKLFLGGDAVSVTVDLEVSGTSTLTGLLIANGGADIKNIQIGVTGDNIIDTVSGNLTLDSAGGTVEVNDNLSVINNNTLTVSGVSNLNGGADIKNIEIGVDGDNEISTTTGNLILDPAGNKVVIEDNLIVNGNNNIIPSGAVVVFYMPNPPIYTAAESTKGWTRVTTENNKALRVVSSGGGVPGPSGVAEENTRSFAQVFTQRSVPLLRHSHQHQMQTDGQHGHGGSTTENGKHTHNVKGSTAGNNTIENADGLGVNGAGIAGSNSAGTNNYSGYISEHSGHQHQLQINDNGGHTHGLQIANEGQADASMNFSVRYIDVILCSKD